MEYFLSIARLCIKGCLLLTFLSTTLLAQKNKDSMQWLSFGQLEDSMKVHPKKILIDVGTSWCAYCKMLDKKTLSDERILAYLSKDYYCVKLNAEEKEAIAFAGHVYAFEPSGNNTGIHALARNLATKEGTVVYPTLVFLSENYQLLYQQQGFIASKDLEKMLSFFAQNAYEKESKREQQLK
jgi:thioredoxin-related protein